MTDIDALIEELLTEGFERSPVMASASGLTDYDERLDDLSADSMLARDAGTDGARGGRALLLVADPGVGIPHGVPGDPAHPR